MAIMIPQIIGVTKGSTILKHQIVIIINRPIRIVASSDLWRKILSLADRLGLFINKAFLWFIGASRDFG
jgi:hypothetical protein